jgi:hypothetical protein
MSKRDLKTYLKGLKKAQLEEQILDLYTRFKPVKTYYNFVFNPNEDKLLDEAKFKISKEYFPLNTRKPKMRRSIAQKIIKHFIQLGVEPYVVAEIMLYNIEIAQEFTSDKTIKQDAFYKSMLKSFKEAVEFTNENGIYSVFTHRFDKIISKTKEQKWMNAESFVHSF